MEDVTFKSFLKKTKTGNKQYCLEIPQVPDQVPIANLKKVTLEDVEDGTFVFMPNPNKGWANPTDCGAFPCTGPWNTYVLFSEIVYKGKIKPLVRLPKFQVIPNNPGFSPM